MPILPLGYATYYWGGLPYYYYNNVYYTWDSGYNGYVATEPPPVTQDDGSTAADDNGGAANDNGGAANAAGTSGGVSDIYVYPRNGQSEEQTSNDRFECHKWAVGQSGYDPTNPSRSSSANPQDYRRAMGACLDARGYSVR